MHKLLMVPLVLFALAFGPAAYADALDGLELDVIDRDETPEAMIQRIELPQFAREAQGDSPRAGGSLASEARERGADFGQESAEQARERRGPPEQIDAPGGRPDDGRPDGAPQPQERPDGGAGSRPEGAQGPRR